MHRCTMCPASFLVWGKVGLLEHFLNRKLKMAHKIIVSVDAKSTAAKSKRGSGLWANAFRPGLDIELLPPQTSLQTLDLVHGIKRTTTSFTLPALDCDAGKKMDSMGIEPMTYLRC